MAKADIINSPNKRTVVAPPSATPGDTTQTSAESMDAQWSGQQEAGSSRTVVVPGGDVANGGQTNLLKCEICDIEFNSPSHAEMHYQGKKHTKKVKLMLEGPTPPPGECLSCSVSYNSLYLKAQSN